MFVIKRDAFVVLLLSKPTVVNSSTNVALSVAVCVQIIAVCVRQSPHDCPAFFFFADDIATAELSR